MTSAAYSATIPECLRRTMRRLATRRPPILNRSTTTSGARFFELVGCRRARFDDGFLHVAQLIFAEEHLLADEECRGAERAAVDRVLRQLHEAVLDIWLLRTREQAVEIDVGGHERLARDLWVIHLLRLFPHVVVGGAEVRLEHALELRSDRAAHQLQGVDRKEWVLAERRDVVLTDETLCLELQELRLVLDAGKRVGGRAVVGEFVDAAEQHRHVREFYARASLDVGYHKLPYVGVGTTEIEQEFDLYRLHLETSLDW